MNIKVGIVLAEASVPTRLARSIHKNIETSSKKNITKYELVQELRKYIRTFIYLP